MQDGRVPYRGCQNFGINTANILALNLFDIVKTRKNFYVIQFSTFYANIIFKSFFLFLKTYL